MVRPYSPQPSPMFDWRGHPTLMLWGADGRAHAFAAAEPQGVQPGGWLGTSGAEDRTSYRVDPAEYLSTWEDPVERLKLCWRRYHSEPVIKAAHDLRFKPIAQADWSIREPGDAAAPATELEKRVAGWLDAVYLPHFTSVVRWLLDAPRDGFAVVEGRYEWVKGGVGPVEFQPRNALSIVEAYDRAWQRDESGKLVAIGQGYQAREGNRMPAPMPVQNVLHAVYDDDGRPDGNSLLRYVHRDADLLDQAMMYVALTLQRYAVPTPIIEAPQTVQFDAAVRARLLDAFKRLRSSDKGAIPLDPGYSARLLGTEGTAWDFTAAVRLYREGIAFAYGVPELLLGSAGGAGHRALAGEFIDVRMKTVEADARWLCNVLQGLADRLVRHNWGPAVRVPQVSYGDLRSRTLREVNESVTGLVTAGIVSKGPELDAHMRDLNGLPDEAADEAVPVTDGSAPTATAAPQAAESVADQALNGAQVSNLLEIAKTVRAGDITPEQGRAIVVAAVPTMPTTRAAQNVGAPDPAQVAAQREPPASGPAPQALAAHRGCGHAFASQPRMAPDERARLLPRLVAVERCVSFDALDRAQTTAIDAILSVAEPYRERLVDELKRQLVAAVKAGSTDPQTAVSAPPDIVQGLASDYLGVLDEVAKAGRRSVVGELNRQGQQAMAAGAPAQRFTSEDDPATTDENARALRRAQAQRLAARTVDPVVEAARDALLRLLRGGAALNELPAAVLGRVDRELRERSLREVATAAGAAVPEVFALARASVIDERTSEGEQFVAYFSTMLDERVCTPCLAVERYTEAHGGVLVGSDLEIAIQPPLHENPVSGAGCDGGQRCRCIKIYQRLEGAASLGPTGRVAG